jgi:hypothetical protein
VPGERNSRTRFFAVQFRSPAGMVCQLDVEIGDTTRLPRNEVAENQAPGLNDRL